MVCLNNMNKLIILRGNSGSGKTTIAKELQRKIGSNTLLISQDVIRREMLMVKDGPDTMALPMLKELLVYGKNHCETVILEGILVGEWYRSLFEQAKVLCSCSKTENELSINMNLYKFFSENTLDQFSEHCLW